MLNFKIHSIGPNTTRHISMICWLVILTELSQPGSKQAVAYYRQDGPS
jgi:hypothetical protein